MSTFVSRYKANIIVFIFLLTILGAGVKMYLTVTQMFHRVGLNIELSYAINDNNLHRVEALLKQGAGPNAADDYDSLILASYNKPMVKLLMKYGANPNISLLAANDIDSAKAMLHLGADVNSRSGYDCDTPLMAQASYGNVEMVKFLLEHGADPTMKSHRGTQQGETIVELVEYSASTHPETPARYQTIIKMLTQASAKQFTSHTHITSKYSKRFRINACQ